MKFFLLLIILSTSLSLAAQTKSETEYRGIYLNKDCSASTYIDFIDYLIKYFNFKFVRKLKNLPIREIKAAIINMGAAGIKQMNIDGQYNCIHRHEDIYQLWNLYYPKVTRETWENLCLAAIPLMELDGVLITK